MNGLIEHLTELRLHGIAEAAKDLRGQIRHKPCASSSGPSAANAMSA